MNVIWLKVIIFFTFLLEAIVFGTAPRFSLNRISLSIQQRVLGISNAFAGGIFLSVGFLHLLAESQEILQEEFEAHYPFALLFSTIGFLVTFFIERVFFAHWHSHHHNIVQENQSLIADKKKTEYGTNDNKSDHPHEDHEEFHSNPLSPYILVIVLSIHSFISGIAVGVQTEVDSIINIFIAIVAHKWVEAFAVGVSVLRESISTKKYFILIGIYSFMEPAGLILGSASSMLFDGHSNSIIEAITGAIASGTFIYIATIDILAEEFAVKMDKYPKMIACSIGYAIMAVLVAVFEHDHQEHSGHNHSH